ncbi:MAG: hypothetical protein P8P74_04575 [Crocinitomicaceae bacterium]|nr:hypothetical protein [Crocinitomicaceae bacterium]
MNRVLLVVFGLLAVSIVACRKEQQNVVEIPDFDFPETHTFDQFLSSYAIYDSAMADLIPSDDFHFVELSSVLYTDQAHRQRLVKVPAGTQMTRLSDGSIDYPEGTILVKTFYYNNDEQDLSLGRRIL